MLQPRTVELKRAKQGAKRAAAAGLELEQRPAVWTGRTRVEKGGDLLLEEVPLEGAEESFGLGQGQPEMLDALMVLVEGDDISDGLFITLIVTHDELQFDTHTELLRVRVTGEEHRLFYRSFEVIPGISLLSLEAE